MSSYASKGDHAETVALLKSKGAVDKYSPRHLEDTTYAMCTAASAGDLEVCSHAHTRAHTYVGK